MRLLLHGTKQWDSAGKSPPQALSTIFGMQVKCGSVLEK